ncbi:MAG: tyrosine-type recombinase/integrase [Victivallales bacterium]
MRKKSRSKGGGHIFKRGKRYYLQYTVNGKRLVRALKTSDHAIAQQRAKERIGLSTEITNKELTVIKIAEAKNILSPNHIKVKELWDKFLLDPSRPDSSPNTLKGYKSAVNIFTKWLATAYPSTKVLNQVTNEIGADFANFLWLEQKVSERTYNAYIKTLFLVFRVLGKDIRNPFAKENISRKNENQQGHYKFTDEELQHILTVFNNPEFKTMHKKEMEILFYLGAFTGLRLIDCCNLKWNCINFEEQIIRTIPEKTKRIKRYAIIPLVIQLEDKLKEAYKWKKDDYILPNVAERYKRNPDGIRKDTIKILDYAGLKTTETSKKLQRKKNICRYGFHSFRHTYASMMASRGYNINMLAKVLGDDTKTLEKYYISIDDKVIKSAFDELISPIPTKLSKIRIQIENELDKLTDKELKTVLSCIKKLKHPNSR